MNNEKMISVVVAIYNVERYLPKCIESIQAQTYSNLEIILINDGSTDKSVDICYKYAEQDRRIRVISRENKGVAYTRNEGIRMATGYYLTFVDSDDYIHPQMYETMIRQMEDNNAEIATCEYLRIGENEKVQISGISHKAVKTQIIEDRQTLKKYMYLEKYVDALLVWNKLFVRQLWDGIECSAGRIYEDETITFKVLHRAKRIVNIQQELYYYVLRNDNSSVTTAPFSTNRLLRLDALETRIIYYIENKDWEFLSEAFFVYKTDFLVVMGHLLNSREYSMDLLKPYMKKYRGYCAKYLLKMQMPAKKKLQYIFFALMPMTYYKRYKNKK